MYQGDVSCQCAGARARGSQGKRKDREDEVLTLSQVTTHCLSISQVPAGGFSGPLPMCRSWQRSCLRFERRAWGCNPMGATSRPSRTWSSKRGTTRACSLRTTTRTGTGMCAQVSRSVRCCSEPLQLLRCPWPLGEHGPCTRKCPPFVTVCPVTFLLVSVPPVTVCPVTFWPHYPPVAVCPVSDYHLSLCSLDCSTCH